MNRSFVSLTLLEGAAVGWVVVTLLRTLTPLLERAVYGIGLVTACVFVAAIVTIVSDRWIR